MALSINDYDLFSFGRLTCGNIHHISFGQINGKQSGCWADLWPAIFYYHETIKNKTVEFQHNALSSSPLPSHSPIRSFARSRNSFYKLDEWSFEMSSTEHTEHGMGEHLFSKQIAQRAKNLILILIFNWNWFCKHSLLFYLVEQHILCATDDSVRQMIY